MSVSLWELENLSAEYDSISLGKGLVLKQFTDMLWRRQCIFIAAPTPTSRIQRPSPQTW